MLLRAIGGSLPLGARLGYVGDSITADGGTGQTTLRNGPRCYASWVGLLSNQRLRYAGRWATGGYQTDQILATHVPSALASDADVVVVQGGVNDIGNSVPVSTIAANLRAIYAAILAGGKTPVATTITPRTSAPAAQKTALWQLNQWISRYAASKRIPCVDWYSQLAHTNSGTDWAAGLSADTAHPNSDGAKKMAQALSDCLAGTNYLGLPGGTIGPLMGEYRPPLVASNVDTACAIGNQLFLTDTNADGIPDNWNVAGVGGTYALAADAGNVLGNYWSITRGANDLDINPNAIAVTEGDVVAFMCRLQTTIAANGLITITVTENPAKSLNLATPLWLWDRDLPSWATLYHEFTVPSGVASVYPRLRVQTGTGTVLRIAQPTWINLTANAIT